MFGNPTVADIDLAQAICERIPAIERVRFLNSGTEALMFAIEAARAMTGRTRLAKLEGAFHGTYDWAEVSARSSPNNWGGDYPKSNPPYRNTPPHVCEEVVVLPLDDTARSKTIIEQHGSDLACIVVDVLPCAAGMIPLNPDYLTMLQDTARRHGILLISDEVVSFRVHYHGASAARGFHPDLVTLGKVVGGGLPIGVVGGTSATMEAFAPHDSATVPQGGTFSANPLTMAAGRAALAALTVGEIDRINELGNYLRQQAEEFASQAGVAITVQGAGSLFRFHAKQHRPLSYREAHHDIAESEALRRLHAGMLERGIYVAAPFWGGYFDFSDKTSRRRFPRCLPRMSPRNSRSQETRSENCHMSETTSPPESEIALFSLLVCDLTAFDDFDTQLLALNLSTLRAERAAVGDIDQLLSAYSMLRAESAPGDVAYRCQALRSNGDFEETLKQILYLLYLGSIRVNGHWKRCGWRQHEDALVWKALGVHSPMTRGEGEFGDWADRPRHRARTDQRNERLA